MNKARLFIENRLGKRPENQFWGTTLSCLIMENMSQKLRTLFFSWSVCSTILKVKKKTRELVIRKARKSHELVI